MTKDVKCPSWETLWPSHPVATSIPAVVEASHFGRGHPEHFARSLAVRRPTKQL